MHAPSSAAPLHETLLRQLRRAGLTTEQPPAEPEAWAALLHGLSRSYCEAEQDRRLLERAQDIASRELASLNHALETSRSRLASLLSLSSDWLWEQDEQGRFTHVSIGRHAATTLDPAHLIGKACVGEASIAARPEALAEYSGRCADRLAFRCFTFTLAAPEGGHHHLRISGEPVYSNGRFLGYRGVGSDVTRSVEAEQQVEQLARFDALTGLPNRHLFALELDRALVRAHRGQGGFAVMLLDLDRFKNINDHLGHAAGDELLKHTAGRLRALLRDSDVLARLGGDEFVLLVDHCADAVALSSVATRALEAIAQPLSVDGLKLQVSCSIGIAQYPADGEDAAALLKNADAAMYLAKAQGKNTFEYYTAQLAQRAAEHFSLEGDLVRAAGQGELRLVYQPKFRLADGSMSGMEALLRWQHPQRGLLMPDMFIGLAEESGQIVPIGRWVLQAACRQIREWRRHGIEVPPCAINLSMRQFAAATLIDDVLGTLAEHGLGAEALELEITESVLMHDPDRGGRMLHRLREAGVRIAIDDFGTGYSSLAYLKRFPAHTLKIDRSFIRGLPQGREDTAITRGVIAMAHSLDMRVVAEGVESPEQLALLYHHGCDEAQGFLLGRPAPPGPLPPNVAVGAHVAAVFDELRREHDV
ncbi:EAL domain-containing protein [Aquincola sp. MAHUQ-54]|uniref:EAL domain-containing protein n=2 Tax=Sphaerotilaceae TaxID=2975441 RepID=A0AAW9Q2U8_9BURK